MTRRDVCWGFDVSTLHDFKSLKLSLVELLNTIGCLVSARPTRPVAVRRSGTLSSDWCTFILCENRPLLEKQLSSRANHFKEAGFMFRSNQVNLMMSSAGCPQSEFQQCLQLCDWFFWLGADYWSVGGLNGFSAARHQCLWLLVTDWSPYGTPGFTLSIFKSPHEWNVLVFLFEAVW